MSIDHFPSPDATGVPIDGFIRVRYVGAVPDGASAVQPLIVSRECWAHACAQRPGLLLLQHTGFDLIRYLSAYQRFLFNDKMKRPAEFSHFNLLLV